ncbi:L-gulonolactone oxidase 3 [Prunus yedoensis var. nudiflora]|uniref:L-gulonolactone oxidase 3 n=1 Tax=Prunus yedoensis var. nudiflora TaxID=2094558 RepID=A0A314Y0Q0_PRUYE|nr:L-gulonolactone oxidase 3 [Prunus yedoensis var. nudiflora]
MAATSTTPMGYGVTEKIAMFRMSRTHNRRGAPASCGLWKSEQAQSQSCEPIFSHHPQAGLPATSSGNSMLISTAKYNSSIEIDAKNLAVTVDAGIGLRRLIDAVEEAGLSLVAAPYWEGVSVGGLVSTGAHGSSWWGKGGAVHDHIVGLSLIVPAKQSEGFAKIVKLEPKDQIFNAAKVSLGLLGVISRYNLVPSKHTSAYRYDNRVPLNASGDGTYDFLGFQSNSILISKSIRATEKTMDNGRSLGGKCTMAASVLG